MNTSYMDFSNDGWFDRTKNWKQHARLSIEMIGLVYTMVLIAINSLVFHNPWLWLPWSVLPYVLFVPVYVLHFVFFVKREFWQEIEESNLGTIIKIDQNR